MYSYSQPYLLVQVRVQFPHSIVFMRPIKSLLVLVFARASGNAVSAVRPWDRGWAKVSIPYHPRSQGFSAAYTLREGNLVPRIFLWERPWLRLVTCLIKNLAPEGVWGKYQITSTCFQWDIR